MRSGLFHEVSVIEISQQAVDQIVLMKVYCCLNTFWGTNVLENATGKNSAYEGSGQK
ncbi:hypothetical protein VCRA2128O305_370036 [Vibrio crassostreae]|nr:hypothetical protein VCRA2112O187_140037 [Vibrio crassostreae]CAK1923916.1 hypothetical protein VCRA2112O185_220036 [Vibrio crassostreae]CAK1926219.1 hypothetical protein VCRA2112E186_230059 [Vibrio crassostreae]CAK1932887.1 hypothetical protein VCRA2118O239_240036 [Vibrio crassostreae]CAK1937578.1 hypothetical protein VCRA2119O245_260059 [Vibrio crassostreae]